MRNEFEQKISEIVDEKEKGFLDEIRDRFNQIWEKGRPYGEDLTKVVQEYVDESKRQRGDGK